MAAMRNVLSFLATAIFLMTVAKATVITVGGADGWTTGVDYKAWASRNPIMLGDTLMFNYQAGYHDVRQVSKEDYDSCKTSNPIFMDISGSTYLIPLTEGKTYVICGYPGHCEKGMKLEINTLGYSGYVPSPPTPYYVPSPPTPTYWQPKGSNAAHRFGSAGSFALTLGLLIMLAAI